MEALRAGPLKRPTFPDLILGLAARRSVRFAYGLAAVVAVVTLAFELTVLLPKPHQESSRAPGAYVAYTVDTRPLERSHAVTIPAELRAAIGGQQSLSVKQHELDRMVALAGQAVMSSFNLTQEQRKQIDVVVTALQKSSAISVKFGKNGG